MDRPEWKTTRFWLTLSLSVVAFAVALGLVSPADRAGIEGAIAKAIEAVGSLAVAAVAIYRYIVLRETVKTTDPNSSGSEGG